MFEDSLFVVKENFLRHDLNVIDRFKIDDSFWKLVGYKQRIVHTFLVPIYLVIILLPLLMVDGGLLSIVLMLSIIIGFIEFTMALTFLFSPWIIWSQFRRKSKVVLGDNIIIIEFAGLLGQWLRIYIPIADILSVQPVSKEYVKWMRSRSIMDRLKIRPRPPKAVNGYYHIFTKPEELISITLRSPIKVYNFFPHSMDGTQGGPNSVPVLTYPTGHILAQASDRQRRSRRRGTGPAIIEVTMKEILVSISKEDRERFFSEIKRVMDKMDPGPEKLGS